MLYTCTCILPGHCILFVCTCNLQHGGRGGLGERGYPPPNLIYFNMHSYMYKPSVAPKATSEGLNFTNFLGKHLRSNVLHMIDSFPSLTKTPG